MIFLVQFGINKHLVKFFKDPKIALALRACANLLVFEKFTRAYLFQIALEIMWLPIKMDQFVHNDLHVDLPFILRPIASYGLQLDLFTNNMFCNFKDQLTFGIIKLCTLT